MVIEKETPDNLKKLLEPDVDRHYKLQELVDGYNLRLLNNYSSNKQQ